MDLFRPSLGKLGFSVGPVQDSQEIHDCRQLQARQAFVEIDVAGKTVKSPGSPVRMSGLPAREHVRAPHLGEHTDEVLQDAGYDDDAIKAFRDAGVI